MTLKVAIVGSGPAGFYTADALLKADSACQIDIIDRLPTPYGLIRFGVAPDHEKTKNVMRGFARTASDDRVNFYGDVDIGDALSLDELREMYDAVVLAVGAAHDRTLGIPGEDKAGVVGSASFVNWYNAHPDFIDRTPDLDTSSVVIIGAGNVAIDVARVLVKTPAEMAATDLPDYAAEPIHAAPIGDVYMVARRGPVEAKFTNVELREMGHLEQCVPQVAAADLPESATGEMSDRDRRVREKNLADPSHLCGAREPTRSRNGCTSCSSRARSRSSAIRAWKRFASSARGSRTDAPSAPASTSRSPAAWWSPPWATSPCPWTARPSTTSRASS